MDIAQLTREWTQPAGPESHVVITSRVRQARNLDQIAFPPRANKDDLRRVCDAVDHLVQGNGGLGGFTRIDLSACSPLERAYLKEDHIISPELEQGGRFRILHIDPRRSCVILVNEEDHLRMYCQRAGFQTTPLLEEINAIDRMFAGALDYAFSEKYGYLTTCPSNVGTGMRASVMLHLPGLVMTQQIDDILKSVPSTGMTVRGYYGEHSEFLGDFYQISNEVTLGKTEEDILNGLQATTDQIVSREVAAREALFDKKELYVEDIVWRAYAVLTSARIMASAESFKLLSPMRLGIDHGLFPALTHERLNRLIVEVQPAHLQVAAGREIGTEERDKARAALLRRAFDGLGSTN
jgi:protein arginine kinase